MAELADATTEGNQDPGTRALALLRQLRQITPYLDASVALFDHRGALEVVAESAERPRLLQAFELSHEQGPTLDAASEGALRINVRLEAAPSIWGQYVAMAQAMGYQTVHSFPLKAESRVVGAVVLGDPRSRTLDQPTVDLMSALVCACAAGIVNLEAIGKYSLLNTQLQGALESRILIEQAKGVLAERLQVDLRAAFDLLRRHARNSGLALRSVASAAIEGELGADELMPRRPGRPALRPTSERSA